MRNNTSQTRVFSPSSSSSRSYSSSFSSSVLSQTPRIRTTEQVWKDLSFPFPPPPPPPISLQHQNPNPNTSHSPFRGVILQDFLSGPFKETLANSSVGSQMPHEKFPLPLPLPPTALSLNIGLDFECHSNSSFARVDDCLANGAPFAPPAFSDAAVGLFSFDSNKRVLEGSCNVGGDRRHERMMKNRESAARSRARKQAYTNELEMEVAHLVAENQKLKKQYEELSLALAAQHSTKKTLQRTLTAPF